MTEDSIGSRTVAQPPRRPSAATPPHRIEIHHLGVRLTARLQFPGEHLHGIPLLGGGCPRQRVCQRYRDGVGITL